MWRICDLYYQCSFGILITVVHTSTSTVLAALCQLPREKKKKAFGEQHILVARSAAPRKCIQCKQYHSSHTVNQQYILHCYCIRCNAVTGRILIGFQIKL